MSAGISTISKKTKSGMSVRTREWGNITKYAPSTPAMAPLAPIVGWRSGDEALRQRRDGAAHQVEDEVAPVPEPVFDVVAEDPQVEHVAEEVQPATVQEHRCEESRPRELGGHDAIDGRKVWSVAGDCEISTSQAKALRKMSRW